MNDLRLEVHVCAPGNFLALDLARGDRRHGLGGYWDHGKGLKAVQELCALTGAVQVDVPGCPACERHREARQAAQAPQQAPAARAKAPPPRPTPTQAVTADEAPV